MQMEASWSPLLSIKSKRNGSYNEPLEPLMKAELERPFSMIRSGTEYDIHKSMRKRLSCLILLSLPCTYLFIFLHLTICFLGWSLYIPFFHVTLAVGTAVFFLATGFQVSVCVREA